MAQDVDEPALRVVEPGARLGLDSRRGDVDGPESRVLDCPSDQFATPAGGSTRAPRLAGCPALVLAAVERRLLGVIERAQRGAERGELRGLGLGLKLRPAGGQEALGALAIDQGSDGALVLVRCWAAADETMSQLRSNHRESASSASTISLRFG